HLFSYTTLVRSRGRRPCSTRCCDTRRAGCACPSTASATLVQLVKLLQAVQRDAIVYRVEASRQVAHLLRPSASPDHPGVLPNLRLEPPHHALDELGKAERSEEHTSELQSRENLVCRLLLEKKKRNN